MSLFSKLSKNNDKTLYPWSQRKLGGSNSALPRAGHAAAAVSADGIVIYGGVHRASTKKELFYIDTNSLSASSINASGDVPSPRISPVIVAMSGHIILYGGKPLSLEDSYDGGLYFLNLHSKQWKRIQMEGNQPIERSGHSAVMHDGIMYIWGGQNEGSYFNDLFIFNSSTFNNTPRWEQLNYNNECPEPRSGHISAIYENKLYIFGGTDGHRLFNDIWSFDLHTGLWQIIEAEGFTPSARESCASAMTEDVIYIVGGKGENGVELNDLCAYKIKSRRWFRFQNMGPCPSPRHGLTMTAVKERLFVLGGDNELSKMDDSNSIYILDSTKIKYPSDTPQHQQSVESPNVQHQQQFQDTSSIEEMNGMSQQQYYQQQQQQQQYQQQQYQQQQPYYQPQQHQGGQAPLQQFANHGQFSPQQQAGQKPFVDQRQPPRLNPPSSPVQQHHARSLVGTVMNVNGVHKEIDTSMNYSDIQPSPTSTTSSSSPSSTSPRHRSYYPDGQSPTQPPVRPPRHISTVPEAALRRPRATSPLPQADTDIAADIRRQYQSNASPTSPTSIENEFLLPRSSPMQPNILAATEDQNFMVDPMLQQQQQQQQHQQQQRMVHGQQQQQIRVSPNGLTAPPPRPPREGVGLGNNQRNTMAAPSPSTSETMMSHAMPDQDEQMKPKSQMPPRNHSVPNPDYVNGLPLATPPQQPSPTPQQQQPVSHNNTEPIPERSPSRQIGGSSPAGSSSPVNAHRKQQQPQQEHTAITKSAVQAAIAAGTEERQTLLREIQARDVIISEMKKKEGWWRTEVSLARKLRATKGDSFDEGPDADEALLMDVDHLAEDKVKLFEQLVSMKSELRRVRASILQQAQPMSEKVNQADRMRTAALQEAAYFKSKYLALKARRQDDLGTLDISRSDELEKRLAAALTENEANGKLLQQLQKRSQHDQTARHATEERAREAQARAEEAQQAHQRALEELESVYARATKAELQVRENAVKIADLTHQLSEALISQPTVKSQEVTEAQLKASQLEAANLKARNETATLKQKLAENLDDIARLRTILNEREDALAEAKIHVEDYEIQLSMLREAMSQQQHQKNASVNNTANGFAPTRAY